ncbi:hypothetical protein Tco_0631194 [Tanacetum coccineum]
MMYSSKIMKKKKRKKTRDGRRKWRRNDDDYDLRSSNHYEGAIPPQPTTTKSDNYPRIWQYHTRAPILRYLSKCGSGLLEDMMVFAPGPTGRDVNTLHSQIRAYSTINQAAKARTQPPFEKLTSDRVAATLAQDRASRGNTNGAGRPSGHAMSKNGSKRKEESDVIPYVAMPENINGQQLLPDLLFLIKAGRMAHTLMDPKVTKPKAERIAKSNKRNWEATTIRV